MVGNEGREEGYKVWDNVDAYNKLAGSGTKRQPTWSIRLTASLHLIPSRGPLN
jgi:hypothetical protein